MFSAIIVRGNLKDARDVGTADAMLAALTPFDQADVEGTWSNERAILVQALTWNTPESKHEATPEVCPDTGRIIASWVRLDNRRELCAALKLEERETLTDPQLILAAHRAWGADCANRLEGDFSFVIYDPDRHEAFCTRDSLGARPLFYHLDRDVFVCATTPALFPKINLLGIAPNSRWIARYLGFLNWDAAETAFEGVSRLPPARTLTIESDETSGPTPYFEFDLSAPDASKRDPQWVEVYRHSFEDAVRFRARSDFLVGAENSGGLDSASIMAVLANNLPHSREDFHSFGMCALEKEKSFILEAAAHSDVRHNHIVVRTRQLDRTAGLNRSFRVLGHPAEHIQPMMHLSFFDLSQHYGIRTMLSGFGGDEAVTSAATWQRWELWHRNNYLAVLDTLPGTFPTRLMRLMKMATGVPQRPSQQHRNSLKRLISLMPLSEDARQSFGMDGMFDNAFDEHDQAKTLNENKALSISFQTAMQPRLETYALFAASYGIEYRWPLLDRALIKTFFGIPAIEKRYRTWGRYLHRRAVADLIPKQIAWMPGKDMGAPIGKCRNVATPEFGSWNDLPSGLRDILDPDALQRLARDVRAGDHDSMNPNLQIQRLILYNIETTSAWLDGT